MIIPIAFNERIYIFFVNKKQETMTLECFNPLDQSFEAKSVPTAHRVRNPVAFIFNEMLRLCCYNKYRNEYCIYSFNHVIGKWFFLMTVIDFSCSFNIETVIVDRNLLYVSGSRANEVAIAKNKNEAAESKHSASEINGNVMVVGILNLDTQAWHLLSEISFVKGDELCTATAHFLNPFK